MTTMERIVREGKTERRIRAMDAADIVEEIHGLEDARDVLEARLAEAERDAAIGRLVRLKLTSGNGVPVERCTIFAHEVTADSASAVQPERCCLDYPRCDCNSPPEPDDDWLCFQRPAQPKVTP